MRRALVLVLPLLVVAGCAGSSFPPPDKTADRPTYAEFVDAVKSDPGSIKHVSLDLSSNTLTVSYAHEHRVASLGFPRRTDAKLERLLDASGIDNDSR